MTDIDQLKKAFQQAIATSASVAASNEPLTRRDTVQAGQVFSAPVVQGGLGSWVASSGYPLASVTPDGVQLGAAAPSRNSFEMNPGLPGVPDVDFVPYNWNTNRFGGKGGALLGHPISWEVVGPTLKSPYCDWQWHVDTTGPTNDVLTMETGPNFLLGAVPTVAQAYNYSANFDAEGGLYVLFTFTGDGFDGSLTGGRTAITGTSYRLRYELFRVGSIAGKAITLRGEKRVGDYFTGGGDGCRAITLIRPKVTRLAALPAPQNGQVQANRIFVFVPPEVSATSEYNPPYDDGVGGAGTWLGGGFDVAGALPAGLAAEYGGTNPLPIPRPVWESAATLDGGAAGEPNKWVINVASLPTTVPPIVRVYSVQRDATGALSNGDESNCLGYFYIDPASLPPKLRLRRVPEVNPDTGAVFWGDGPFDSGFGTVDVRVQFFESVESLFLDASLNYTKLAAARLTNLIDPRTAGPSVAYRDTTGGNAVPASKSDRAIFNTKPGEDPGNLLDLGFRAVYFPAKKVGPNAVPDFDNPIDSEDVQLTPNPTSRQFIETDYSAGVAYLSETPLPGGSCQVAPTLAPFFATNNPRKEIVLFAACVPYSMEEGQTGDGIRVTASSLKSIEVGFGEDDLADVYGRRIIARFSGVGPFSPGPGASILTDLTSLSQIPSSGFFFFIDSIAGVLQAGTKIGPFYYQSTSLVGPVVQLDGVSGPTGPHLIGIDTRVVLQRSLQSFAPTSASADTVRGSSKRISALSFKGADVTFGADGSVSVEPRTTLQKAYEAGNTIDVTAAEGYVSIVNSTDATTNLALERIVAGFGYAMSVGMSGTTTSSAIFVNTKGSGSGIEVLQNGSAATGHGFNTTLGSSSAAKGLKVVHAGTAATVAGADITLTGITAGDGISVSLTNAAATGDALNIVNNGSGRGIYLKAGTGYPLEVYNSASAVLATIAPSGETTFYYPTLSTSTQIQGGRIQLFDAPGPPALTSILTTTDLTITDGTNTSTVAASSVTSNAFLYPVAPLQQISISPLSMRSGRYENVGTIVPPTRTSALLVNFTQEWRPEAQALFGPPDFISELGYFSTTTRGLDGILDLTPYLRTGMTIDQIDVHVNPATAQATSTNRISVILYSRTVGGGGPTVLAGPIYDSGASGIQQITFSSLGVLVNLAFTTYYLVITSSQGANTLPGDAFHGVWLRVFDPGPRNY